MFIVLVFFWSQVSIPIAEIHAQIEQHSECQEFLNNAQREYYNGNFEAAIEIIKRCLVENSITDDEQFRAYKILAQTYIAKDNNEAAITVIRKLLEMNADYKPTMEQEPPPFVKLVARIKAELAVQNVEKTSNIKGEHKTWLWVTAGSAVVIAGVAVILISMHQNSEQEKEKPSLPIPPDWPSDP